MKILSATEKPFKFNIVKNYSTSVLIAVIKINASAVHTTFAFDWKDYLRLVAVI